MITGILLFVFATPIKAEDTSVGYTNLEDLKRAISEDIEKLDGEYHSYEFSNMPVSIPQSYRDAYPNYSEEDLCDEVIGDAIHHYVYDKKYRDFQGDFIFMISRWHSLSYYTKKYENGKSSGYLVYYKRTDYSAEQLRRLFSDVRRIVANLNLYGKSDYEKTLAIVRWEDEHVQCWIQNADGTYTDPQMNDVYDAFYRGYSACSGHSELFSLLAYYAGLDSTIVVSSDGNHAWNLVKLDGKYYHVDVTHSRALFGDIEAKRHGTLYGGVKGVFAYPLSQKYQNRSQFDYVPKTNQVSQSSVETTQNNTSSQNFGWKYYGNKFYWYESDIKQGVYGQKKNVIYDGTERGREIYDPQSDGWYWLDTDANGAMASDKEVFIPYVYQNEGKFSQSEIARLARESNTYTEGYTRAEMSDQVERAIRNRTGKWVRYNRYGKMYKGWYTVEGRDATIYPNQVGNTYYYDYKTGLMAKGKTVIDGKTYYFDEVTGVLKK